MFSSRSGIRKWFQTQTTLPKALLNTLHAPFRKCNYFFKRKERKALAASSQPKVSKPSLYSVFCVLLLSKCGCSKHSDMETEHPFMRNKTSLVLQPESWNSEPTKPCFEVHLTATRECSQGLTAGVREGPKHCTEP